MSHHERAHSGSDGGDAEKRAVTRRKFLGGGIALSLMSTGLARLARAQCTLTTTDPLGPYFVAGAPQRNVIASADEPGSRLFLDGIVRGVHCSAPLPATIVDVWQASNAGCYSISQPCGADEDPWNLRGQFLTGLDGTYTLETILPGYYPGRCLHIHFRFAPVDGPVLVTQLYFEGDPQIPNDPFARLPSAVNRIIPLVQEADGLHGVFDLVLNVDETDAGDEGPDPDLTYLHTGFPNPFQSSTMIRFSLARAGGVDLAIYDVSGRRVRSLLDRDVAVGYHTADWDGRDDAGRPVGSGVYFCRMLSGGESQTRKLMRQE